MELFHELVTFRNGDKRDGEFPVNDKEDLFFPIFANKDRSKYQQTKHGEETHHNYNVNPRYMSKQIIK